MSVWVSPCQTRSIELDIRYLLSIWSQIYRIPLRAGLLLLYTVIITENYNQFYHQSTLTQCTQNRLASPYAISPISPILQNIKICQKAIWVKIFLDGGVCNAIPNTQSTVSTHCMEWHNFQVWPLDRQNRPVCGITTRSRSDVSQSVSETIGGDFPDVTLASEDA